MLFAGTIRENLLYGNADASDERLDEVAADAHADIFIRDLPKGYGELVGERGITLSAGQRQRFAIARVMLERPRVLILDEASSSLDAESERLVQDALERILADRTTLSDSCGPARGSPRRRDRSLGLACALACYGPGVPAALWAPVRGRVGYHPYLGRPSELTLAG